MKAITRTGFLGAVTALGGGAIAPGAYAASDPIAPAGTTPGAKPANALISAFDANYVFLGVLGGAYYGVADVGMVLSMIDQSKNGRPAESYAALTAGGALVRARADAALAAGHRVTARQCFLQSSNYTFGATYFCDGMGAPEKLAPTWKSSRAALDAGLALFDPPVEHLKIPYENTTLPGYLFKVDNSGVPRPLLIMINGSDGSVLDMWVFGGADGVARGYNCLAIDGPGQGAALFEQGLPFRPDFEKVVTPVVDFMLRRPDVDPKRIAIEGISQGGYWVPRALAFEHRIAAGVADPGVVDVSTSWTASIPPQLVALLDDPANKPKFDAILGANKAGSAALAFRSRPFGITDPFDLYTTVRKYSLAGLIDKITTPMLVMNPEGEQFWPGQSQRLYDGLTGQKAIANFTVAEGAQYHCEPLGRGLAAQRMFDWLDATLAKR